MAIKTSRAGTITLAITLISVGVLWLISNITGRDMIWHVLRLWPVVLVMLGIELLMKDYLARKRGDQPPGFDFGSIFLIVVIVVILVGLGAVRGLGYPFSKFEIFPGYVGIHIGDRAVKASREARKSMKIPGNAKHVRIINPFGKVVVLPGPVGEISVASEITGYGPTPDLARKVAEEADISLAIQGETAMIQVSDPGGSLISHLEAGRERSNRIVVDSTIEVPPGLQVEIRNSFGKILARGLRQDVSIENSLGNVDVENVEGALSVRNSYGAITMTGVAGDIEVSNSFGRVEAKGHLGKTYIRNSMGSVRVKALSPISEDCYISTRFGSIDFALPFDSVASIRAETEFGRIENNLGLPVEKEVTTQRVRGTLGKGGGNIVLETTHGNIQIRAMK